MPVEAAVTIEVPADVFLM
jgi:hypothetical protein